MDGFTSLHSGLISCLDAGFGQLGRLESNGFPAAGGMLLLGDGEISEVAPSAFFRLTRLARADLSVNLISGLTGSSLRFSADPLAAPSFNPGAFSAWPSARMPFPPGYLTLERSPT